MPSRSPSLTDVPADLALADRLYYEGDFEQAISIYKATATRGMDSERGKALWTLVKVQ